MLCSLPVEARPPLASVSANKGHSCYLFDQVVSKKNAGGRSSHTADCKVEVGNKDERQRDENNAAANCWETHKQFVAHFKVSEEHSV